jgi:uncharacterized membrane protein (UPF0127 family)
MTDQSVSFAYEGKEMTVSARVCRDSLSKGLGKMFSLNRKPLLFVFGREQDVWIHMHFVFMPLLVVWLDENMKPVKTKLMKPFISLEHARAKYVLEVPM